MLHQLFEHVFVQEDVAYARRHHYYAPELRRGDARDETAAVVYAEIFYYKAPYAVGYAVHRQIAVEPELKVEHRHRRGEHEQEYAFQKLHGNDVYAVHVLTEYVVVAVRAGEAYPRIGGPAVAATRKEAAQPAERMRDADADGNERHRVGEAGVHVVLQELYLCPRGDDIYIEVVKPEITCDAAYKAAVESHGRAEIERARFDIVIDRLKEHGEQNADGRGNYAEQQHLVGAFLVEVLVPERPHEECKAADYAYRHAQTVGVDLDGAYGQQRFGMHALPSCALFSV